MVGCKKDNPQAQIQNQISNHDFHEFRDSLVGTYNCIKHYYNNQLRDTGTGPYSIITDSSYGRNPDTKYNLDIDYYTNMSKSKFTLCPTGDCPWSYRFFEAIMCFSIPILNDKSDIFCKDYYYIMYGDEYVYSHEQALENYNKLLTRCTLINKIIK